MPAWKEAKDLEIGDMSPDFNLEIGDMSPDFPVHFIFRANDGDHLPLWSASGIEVR